MTPKKRKAIRAVVSNFFKNSKGEPYELTDGQCDIFDAVLRKGWKYVWISAITRYGKTEVVAIAITYGAAFLHLKIPVVAGSKKKAEKIMEYVTQHLPDHPELSKGLINLDVLKDVEKLKVRVAKDALRWATGGWIYITSINAKQISSEGEDVVGEGGDIVVVEEAGLIKRKEQISKVIRMAEGDWRKLVEIGNCIEKSVVEDAYNNPLFKKIRIGLAQAIREGRITKAEAKVKKTLVTAKDWIRYYLVRFPKAGEFSYFKPKAYDHLPPSEELEFYGSLDPALGESAKGSDTAIIVLARHKVTGQVYEISGTGEKITPDVAMNNIFKLPHKFLRFGVETVQFQSYFKKHMEDKSKELGLYIPFEKVPQKRKKEERIESIEPIINTGQVLFNEGSRLWNDMQAYPDTEKMDVLDALEICLRIMGMTGYDPKNDTSRISW